jgi:hypothetical protein
MPMIVFGHTFDANGNTITSGGVTHTFNFEDRLLSTSNGVTIVYDQTPTGYVSAADEKKAVTDETVR